MPKWHFILGRLTSKLWFRASLFCIIGIFTALLGLLLRDFIPENISRKVGADAVDTILHILASSMLAVTTFSLSTVVAAYASASSNATPRATTLLLEDSTAQNALSTFIGSFLYSLVGIIALSMGVYGDSGRLVLFVVTLCVIFVIIAMLLQWIEHLSQLGRVGHTIDMVEKASRKAISQLIKRPFMGGAPLISYTPFPLHRAVTHPVIGYIEHIDMRHLSSVAERLSVPLFLRVLPGHFNDSLQPVVFSASELEEKDYEDIRDAFSIGNARSFDQDPRYGLVILGEIASRALSPAVNDPGTSIVVIGTILRLLAPWAMREVSDPEILYPMVHVPPVENVDLFAGAFAPIARDGASMVEVGIHLQKALHALGAMRDKECAQQAHSFSKQALDLALLELRLDSDKDMVQSLWRASAARA